VSSVLLINACQLQMVYDLLYEGCPWSKQRQHFPKRAVFLNLGNYVVKRQICSFSAAILACMLIAQKDFLIRISDSYIRNGSNHLLCTLIREFLEHGAIYTYLETSAYV